MGLDIYGHLYKRTRSRKSDESLRDYYNALEEANDKLSMKECKKAISDGISKLKQVQEAQNGKLFPFDFMDFDNRMERFFPYDYQRQALKKAKTIEDVEKWAKSIEWNSYYKPSDAYFRKVNCIYRFFQDKLEDEICEVTKDDIVEAMNRAIKVLAAHDEKTAEELLPTQKGFFFGSTNYDAWYFEDMKKILEQFGELLNRWKEGETCFIIMSW